MVCSLRPRLSPFAALLVLAPAAAAQQFAAERIMVSAGLGPGTGAPAELGRADVDGDGRDELLVRHDFSTDQIFRGTPKGFEWVDIVDASDSHGFDLGDIDGDGRADLLTQDFVQLGWYPGRPDATFGSFEAIQAEGPNEVFWDKKIGDLNGDGLNDAVSSVSTTPTGSNGGVRVYLNLGVVGFGSPLFTGMATSYPIDIALGDLDADGALDVVAAPVATGPSLLFYNTGTGVLGAPQDLAASGAEARFVETGDFDADGITDVACLPYAATLTWFQGGPGGPTLGGTVALPGPSPSSRDLQIADANGDGADDLLAVQSVGSGGQVHQLLGSPGSGLGPATSAVDLPGLAAIWIEYDGGGWLDLAFLHTGWINPELRPSDGQGGYLEPVDVSSSIPCGDGDGFCVGDVDRDGTLDLAFENGQWRAGDGQGGFGPPVPLGANPSELVDLNGDGWLDAIGLHPQCAPTNGIHVSLGSPAAFGASVKPAQAAGLVGFALGDLDADGDLDLASAGLGGVYTHLNAAGSFAPFATTALPGAASAVAVGDLDADGLADVVMTRYLDPPFGSASADMFWGLSAGDGQLAGVQTTSIYTAPQSGLRVHDVDGDGNQDAVWSFASSMAVVTLYGDGAGNLGSQDFLLTLGGTGAQSFAFADVSGDGTQDLLMGAAPGSQTQSRIVIGRSDGVNFLGWRELHTQGGAGKIVPADVDADGRMDLLWGNGGGAWLALNRLGDPAGLVSYGAGTPGCEGRLSLGGVEPAELGNADFRLLAHNLPPNAPGWIALGDENDVAGSDPFGLGALLHLDPLAATFLELYPAGADANGQASLAAPIPQLHPLAGTILFAQGLYLGTPGNDCSTSPFTLVSSRGSRVVIQP